ncbi:MAG: hypothetical protein G3M78_07885 [Candidatus Nitrohelix vancouverensis]|uniref:Tr-type G domain-containing protein n=1 Tax=Candidatus Nitrohelix vancouverensis TaxID=2705534 RepID=A0A7T0G3G5_9BACT|nr:MAG: hypothetical protein G3M78_07885 [Candidatus Nitrohelix vancouverensis]
MSEQDTKQFTENLPIIIVGHVDHGKSTLIGRLLCETGNVPQEKFQELQRLAESEGREFEYSSLLDYLEEERKEGRTIDIAHTYFQANKRNYIVIDSPGHHEFLKKMITGASQAEAAILLIDIQQGICEQTRRHCYILSLLGIEQIAVLVNKMDLVEYSQSAFGQMTTEILEELSSLNLKAADIIPVSAKNGDNIVQTSHNMPWYTGPTALSTLGGFGKKDIADTHLRFPIQGAFDIDGQTHAVGRIESGVLKKGQTVHIYPDNKECKVLSIKKFQQEKIDEVHAGECVGVLLEGIVPQRGNVVTDVIPCRVGRSFRAHVFCLENTPLDINANFEWKCTTQEATARIQTIYNKFDPAFVSIDKSNSKQILPGEVAEVEITLNTDSLYDRFSEIPELGRFVFEISGNPVAGGVIL